ncbi:MAG: hypothetical protein CVU46_03145 [Chloroflexi bacterium HGW-Chloroflexi-8]|nr:MAG: hypothetical protein CVU46_03145 [Chloroflexi bacterium HGW-Chloroflexi-8]
MIGLSFEMRSGESDRVVIDLNASGYRVLNGYFPESGNETDVSEAFDLMVIGASESDLETKIRAIELALDYAKDHQSGPDGVWILFTTNDGVLDDWQSRVSGGAVLHDNKLGMRWKETKAKIQVVVYRRPYWETVNPVTLTIDNGGGDPGETAVVYNHEDAGSGHDFYVEIGADQVTGSLATPAIIEFKNSVNDAELVDHLMVGHFAASSPHEPPASTLLILEGSGTADANCSGGEYDDLTWADAVENQIASWSLATGDLRQRYFRFVARFREVFAYTDLWLKVKLLSGSNILSETRWTLMNTTDILQMIGSLQIPPFRHGNYVDIGNLTVGLYEKRAAGAGTFNLDFLAMMPQDGWRKFGAFTGLAYNETLIDNPVEEKLVTHYSTSSYKVTHMLDEGEPIMLQPGVKNLLYFLHDLDDGTSPIARTASITIKCHPRRRSV